MLGRGAPGVTATCGRRCPGSSGVVSQPVWSLCTGTPLSKEMAVWGWGLTGVQDRPLGVRHVRRARSAGCSPASELRLLRSKITAQKPELPFAPSPLPRGPQRHCTGDYAEDATGLPTPTPGLGLRASSTCLECAAEDEVMMLGNQHHCLRAVSPFLQLPSVSFLSF